MVNFINYKNIDENFTNSPNNIIKNTKAKITKDVDKLKDIEKTAREFEAYILSSLYKISAEQIPVNKFYGGGKAEEAYRSILIDEQVNKALNNSDQSIGIKKLVIEQMLRK